MLLFAIALLPVCCRGLLGLDNRLIGARLASNGQLLQPNLPTAAYHYCKRRTRPNLVSSSAAKVTSENDEGLATKIKKDGVDVDAAGGEDSTSKLSLIKLKH